MEEDIMRAEGGWVARFWRAKRRGVVRGGGAGGDGDDDDDDDADDDDKVGDGARIMRSHRITVAFTCMPSAAAAAAWE